MSEKLAEYDVVLEIGCGTGFITLAIVEAGHNVLAVEKSRPHKKAKILIEQNGKSDKVHFIEGDVVEDSFRKFLFEGCEFDVVIGGILELLGLRGRWTSICHTH